MTISLVVEHFDNLLSTPEDVEQLNRAILQMAMQGKLSMQNSEDEPAIDLLDRLSKQKSESDKQKSRLNSDRYKIDNKPFDLPSSWEWTKLGDVCLPSQYGWTTKASDFGNFYFVRTTDISSTEILDWDTVPYCQEEPPNIDKYLLKDGDIVISRAGSVGISLLVKDPLPAVFASYLIRFRPLIDEKYVSLFLRSPLYWQSISDNVLGIAVPNVNAAKLSQMDFPLPPLAEQRRIVARVEELFVQTRALAKELEHSRIELDGLNKSALSHLLASETPEEFNQHWHFVAEHFDLLFQAPEHVAPLRQSILELAVRGKLTRREAGDESAGELLKRISEEKEDKGKPLPVIKDSAKPFDLPEGWEWARFPEIGELGRGKSKHRPRNAPFLFEDGKYPFVQTGDVAQSGGHIRKYSTMYSEQGLAQSRMWNKGTLCITIAANIAETGILEFDACFPDSVVGFVPSSIIGDAEYFQYFIKVAKSQLESYAPATAQKNINLGILQDLLIPLPPLAELKRIVKRVEQLLSLCDALEARLQSAEEERGRLVAAVMAGVGS